MTGEATLRRITVEANGYTVHAVEAGTGPLVIALHGFPDLPVSYRFQIPVLVQEGYRVVAPYMRGLSPSDPASDGPFEVAACVQDVLALINQLTDQPAVLIGHDWGATVARNAAILAPEKVSRIVCMSVPTAGNFAQALISNPEQQRRSWYVFFFQLPFAEMAIAHEDFQFIDRLWKEWSPRLVLPPSVLHEIKEAFRNPSVLKAALGYYRSLFNPAFQSPAFADMRKRFTDPIPVPTLYLHGAEDGCIGVETTEGMEFAFPAGLEKHVVPSAGHFLHQEQPEIVNRLLISFLSQQKGR